MCGIIMCFQKEQKANSIVTDIFQDQHSRGTQGFGGLYMNPDQTFKIERSTDELNALLGLRMTPANLILFHHRTPTSTENKVNQTHPLLVKNSRLKYDYLVAHNGIISNNEELKKLHEKAGFKYLTECEETSYSGTRTETKFNDSETLAIEITMYIEKLRKNLRTEGSAAFVAAQIDKKTQKIINIFFGRNHQVLTISTDKKSVTISSEGQKKDVEQNKLFKLSIPEAKITSEPLIFKEKETEVIQETKFNKSRTYYTSERTYMEHTHWDNQLRMWMPNKGYIWNADLRCYIQETKAFYSENKGVDKLITDCAEETQDTLEEFFQDLGAEYDTPSVDEICARLKNSLNMLDQKVTQIRLNIEAAKADV